MSILLRSKLNRRTKEDVVFDLVNVFILTGALLLVLYPLYFILIASVSNPDRIFAGDVLFFPRELTFDGYKRIFSDSYLWMGYRNSMMYAVLGTVISLSMILPAAYALSRKDLIGRKFIILLLILTMFFEGGLVPTYLLVKNLNMIDTIWAMVLPSAIGVWNVIVSRIFFESNIPDEMREAAFIDGCSNTKFFLRIVLPLSKPIIAVMVLIHVIGNWNMFFNAMIYLNHDALYPLQIILRNILIQNEFSAQSSLLSDLESYAAQQKVSELIKYGVIFVASFPLLVIYPFVQKYFVKGMMIGAVKG